MKNYILVALIMTGVFLLRLGITPVTGKISPFMLFLGAIVIISRKFPKGPLYFGIMLGALFGGCVLHFWGNASVLNTVSTSLMFMFVSITFAIYEMRSYENLLRKNQELNLARQEQEFILDASGIGIFRQDLGSNRIKWSESYKQMRGFAPGEFMTNDGEISKTWVHPDDREKVVGEFEKAILDKRDYAADCRLLHKDGHYFWVNARAKIIFDTNGVPVRVLGAVISIDERIKVRERLEEEVQKRTSELKFTQGALVQSSRLSALGEMAGGVAHEMNSPLSVLRLKSEQIIRKIHLHFTGQRPVSEEQLIEDMKKNISTIDRLSSIIKGLRYFSREGIEDVATLINLRDLIDQVLQFVQAKYNYDGIDLQIDTGPNDLNIICRKAEIEQVVLSLMQNSYDSIVKQSHKWIRIEAGNFDSKVFVKIIDSGEKIPKEVVEKMWQPFFTTKEVGMGMGLGLSIAKGIIEKHGGTLNYDDTAAHTTFTMTLPFKCEG